MAAQAKYMFDLDFAAPAGAKQANTIALAAHEAAVAEAEARGYANGLAAAEARARTQAEQDSARAYQRIGAELARLASELPQVAARTEADAVAVAAAIAQKLAPALIAREPFAEIAALAAASLRELIAAPHVAIRVNDALYPTARERLAEMARGCGFEGRLLVLGEAEIAPGDCRIEWADGGLVRDRAAIAAAVSEAVDRYLAGRGGPANA